MKVLLSVLILFMLASCGNLKSKIIKCTDSQYAPIAVGYTQTELDTISVKWFQPGSSYATVLDSFTFHFDWSTVTHSADTLYLPFYREALEGKTRHFDVDTDIEVCFPNVNRKYRIGSIQSSGPDSQDMGSHPDARCGDLIKGYTLDGKEYNFPDNTYPKVYMVK
jgi:hypothetical protein